MPSNDFAPYLKMNGCFVVRNVSPYEQKTIRIFHYPIMWAETRDLLQIPGVDEADIRGSLLKGELNHKIRAKDIVVVCSDIDLLQFNNAHKKFLQDAGIVNGLEVTGAVGTIPYVFKEEVQMVGAVDSVNRTFRVPDKFIKGSYFGNDFNIIVTHNGRELFEGTDFICVESGGLGSGYDTIELQSFTPRANHSLLYANYVVAV